MTSSQRRGRYTREKIILGSVLVVLVGVLVAADRLGVLGRGDKTSPTIEEDLASFDGKTFAVSKVVDGDTLWVHVPGPHAYDQKVRLLGVDTPETVKPNTPVQHFGLEASDFAKRTLSGQSVKLQLNPKETRDKYNRLLAYITLADGTDFDALLIKDGYGFADPRFAHPRKKEYLKLGDEARKAKRGLWKDATDKDLPSYMKQKPRP